MGFLIVLVLNKAIQLLGQEMIVWMILGGVFYMGGLAFYFWKKLPYQHAVWHIMVLGGSCCHFFGILYHIAGKQ